MNFNFKKQATSFVCGVLSLSMLLCGCSQSGSVVNTDSTAADTSDLTDDPSSYYPSDKFRVISKSEYLDKTTAGFISQLTGFLSGYEFVTLSNGRCRVAMPDSWFGYLKGPYADPNEHKTHTDKLLYNTETKLWEVWFDDDFSIDVVNQYILSDMYKQKSTVSQKYITDGWLKYDVYDMGGGQRSVGAYGLFSKYNFLPQFAGNTEYGNWYSYCTEAYLGTDTLGMNAAGMPKTASEVTGIFASTAGDRDNVAWAQMFSAMMSLAYFESDVPTLIREASKVFPEGSWPLTVIDDVFDVYEKYPNNWRRAYTEFEDKHFVEGDTKNTDTDINCGFVLLDLLYGGGDYLKTCRIGSLAGYDCESTCGIALSILGIIGGMDVLPEETNKLIWQNGKGVLTNLNPEGLKEDYWMTAQALPDRMKIADVVDRYRKNFESILLEKGGGMDDENYYIPIETLPTYKTISLTNADFETGDLEGYTVVGEVSMTELATTGFYAAKLTNNAEIYGKISGLKVGATYQLGSFISVNENSTAHLIVRDGKGTSLYATVHNTTGTPRYEAQSSIRRTLTFTATESEMEFGVIMTGTNAKYAIVDSFWLFEVNEAKAGEVSIVSPRENSSYKDKISFNINCDTNKEVYLKLTFANLSGMIPASIKINGYTYSSAAFYKTQTRSDMSSADSVYIPLMLKTGDNTVELSFNKYTLSIFDAQLVLPSFKF